MTDPLDYCRVEGCGRRACRHGLTGNMDQLCSAHFQRLKRTGDVMANKPIIKKHRGCNLNEDGTRKACKLNGCESLAHSRGFCHMHWKRMSRNDGIAYSHVPVNKLHSRKAEIRAEERMRKGA